MLNRVELIGRLGKDPETRYTQGGTAVTSFSVATTETWKDKQTGEKQERTEWTNVTAFGRLGEVCGEYLRKGALVFVAGKLQTDKYEKDGQTRYATKVVCSEMKMLGSKQDSQSGQNRSQGGQAGGPTLPAEDELSDDIPFMTHERGWLV